MILWLLSCFNDYSVPMTPGYIPDMTVQTLTPEVEGATPRRVEDYLLPQYGPDAKGIAACAKGEDVRDQFGTTWATVEVQRWGVMANGSYTLSLSDGVLDGSSHTGNLLPLLYDTLVQWRLNAISTGAGMKCWPEFEGRLLVIAEPQMSYSVVQRIVYTAQQAGFQKIDLLVEDPETVRKAVAKAPYPAFSERGPELDEPRPRLSDEEIERAREQLAAGQRIRGSGEACVDLLDMHVDGTWASWPRHGGALLDEELGAGTPTLLDGRLETVVHAGRDAQWKDVVSLAHEMTEHGDVSLDIVTTEDPSYSSLGTHTSSTWLSYNTAQWIPVVELTPQRIGTPLSCVDDQGRIWE